MGLSAQTSKQLARLLVEHCETCEKADELLDKWCQVKGTNGNFRMTLSEISVFVKKIINKSKNNINDKIE